MSSFWKTLPTTFLVLAPMEDVTDVVFREIVSRIGRPDVFFTEFTSADGLMSAGRDRLIRKLEYTPNQRPIVAQIWGNNPKILGEATTLIRELGFDGVDINMGCPVPVVVKKGSGAGCIGNYDLVRQIIQEVRESAGGMSVSVKTRLGISQDISDEWIPFLLEQNLDALTIHGRTARQKSEAKANWDVMKQAVEWRDAISPDTVIIGNGDVMSHEQALQRHADTGVDGVMIGRGIFHNPWIFNPVSKEHGKEEFLEVLKSHVELFEQTWGKGKNFDTMKKFFKMYVKDFDGASHLRQQLMECENKDEVLSVIK